MAEQKDGLKIEVTGVGAIVDEMTLTLLLESKRKMGRQISVTNVIFNRDRNAALVTLENHNGTSVYQNTVKLLLEGHSFEGHTCF